MASTEYKRVRERLDYYYRAAQAITLSRQNPNTGLIPASVAVTTHGDYRDAWVRDNVYSILCVFGLALAYRRVDDELGRGYELEHATIKLMRGLLFSMMRQSSKVERFKYSLALSDALHAKYNTNTGDTVVGDQEWGHLQVDATSLFLLMLAQMTAAGFQVIYTLDEVDFVQNLVFYIERAYRTPDYGIWERGNKVNHGEPELNSSSIGIVVAALQAIHGINLFGPRGGPSSVIHVLPDELTRNYMILHSALPRESFSKEIDAALLAVIGYPAYAVADETVIERTRQEIKSKLQGRYGCRRFLRDGHQAVLEDNSRLHYDPRELQIFENIECEWPLFFTYFILDGLFRGDHAMVEEYREALGPLLVDSTTLTDFQEFTSATPPMNTKTPPRTSPKSPGIIRDKFYLIPELYYVPHDAVEAEKANPHSQHRLPNDNVPLVWANSLFMLGNLINENLVSAAEVDPLGRRFYRRRMVDSSNTVVQIALLSEDEALQSKLSTFGLQTQTIDQLGSVTVCPPNALQEVYVTLGMNEKLGLSGRPPRPVGTLSTCRLYRVQGRLYAFIPHFLDRQEFYLSSDNDYLVSVIESQLMFVKQHWSYAGRPTLVILLTHQMFNQSYPLTSPPSNATTAEPALSKGSDRLFTSSQRHLLHFIMNLRTGKCCNGAVRVRLANLTEMIPTSCIESLDFLVNKNEVDWLGILRGCQNISRSNSSSRLGDLGKSPQLAHDSGSATPGGGLQRSSSFFSMQSGLKTPVERKEGRTASADGGYFSLTNTQHPHAPFKLLSPEMPSGSSATTPSSYASAPSGNSRGGVENDLEEELNALGLESSLSQPPSASANTCRLDTAPADVISDSNGASGLDNLALTLGDPGQVSEAIAALKMSNNLFDQMDLLHYLFSCYGLKHYVEEFDASIYELVEEIYMKAQHMKLWGIVRQAAGVLEKVVNNQLTICITDLVVRLKQVTIGHGSNEYVISRPVPPDAINDILRNCCSEDVREIPLVQEVIINLADLIQAKPAMFEGLMRLRTHFIIIALREEISRLKNFDENDALEFLLQMSPFELKALINTVLSGPSLCQTSVHTLVRNESEPISSETTIRGWRNVSVNSLRGSSASLAATASTGVSTDLLSNGQTHLTITAHSAGYNSGNFAHITVNDIAVAANHRGINAVVVDPLEGVIAETMAFDTHLSESASQELAEFLQFLEPSMVVILVAKDDCAERLSPEARQACQVLLGSRQIQHVQYRDSWCMVGYKGAAADQVVEALKRDRAGPTDMLHICYNLNELRQRVDPAQRQQTLSMATGGRWLRRRKNDGALNRVPPDFYPRVWKVLEHCRGLTIFHETLHRDPLIFEKTAEEPNFALCVESFLDVMQDPAERQIAVECLMALSFLQQAHPEVHPGQQPHDGRGDAIINVTALVKSALVAFWQQWTQTHPDYHPSQSQAGSSAESLTAVAATGGSGGSQNGSVPFNERLARRLFYDLPAVDEAGTVYYLARSMLAHVEPARAQSLSQECIQQYRQWEKDNVTRLNLA